MRGCTRHRGSRKQRAKPRAQPLAQPPARVPIPATRLPTEPLHNNLVRLRAQANAGYTLTLRGGARERGGGRKVDRRRSGWRVGAVRRGRCDQTWAAACPLPWTGGQGRHCRAASQAGTADRRAGPVTQGLHGRVAKYTVRARAHTQQSTPATHPPPFLLLIRARISGRQNNPWPFYLCTERVCVSFVHQRGVLRSIIMVVHSLRFAARHLAVWAGPRP